MPKATNNAQDLEHHDLKTCPGGFVKLRRMTYGQFLKRQAMSMDMQMRGNRGNAIVDVGLGQEKVTTFEFSICVAEHNLEDDNDQLLDFKSPAAIQILDPRIGQEIGALIDAMNQFEEQQVGNFERPSDV